MDSIQVALWRRLAAAVYDSIILLALYFVAALLAVVINDGEAVETPLFFLALLFITWAFFVKFWCSPGQTLGMQVWKVKVVNERGGPLTSKQASARLVCSLLSWGVLGLGFIWALFDKEGLTWHDKLSQSRLVFIDHKKQQAEK
ncbi:hypothetical protein MED121_19129 [Marinomonas sp. MED121]|uniref:RDD family protein n=1 Tax=Marinomonas sp. MED121 TaxID=314277 RepID=UPI0000690F2A|nr:RDD family protein [Marinomonas sp. MED121]EAQ64221.1 hypothetical protein MED121_19129 [Marinomonas sp. MED121]